MILTFSTIVAHCPVFADCNTGNQPDSPRACCVVHTHALCCQVTGHTSSRHRVTSNQCRTGNCHCSVAPAQNNELLQATTTECPDAALIVTLPTTFASVSPNRDSPIVVATYPLPSTSLCASSPRAPPFQG